LPYAGGVFDQPADIMDGIEVVESVVSEIQEDLEKKKGRKISPENLKQFFQGR